MHGSIDNVASATPAWSDFIEKRGQDVSTAFVYPYQIQSGAASDNVNDWGPDGVSWAEFNSPMIGATRGMYKAIRDLAPGAVDNLIGNAAGVVNGSISALRGGRFHDGFNRSRKFVSDYYSGPLRSMLMSAGGGKLRDAIDSTLDNYAINVLANRGEDAAKDLIASTIKAEHASDIATSLALGLPLYYGLYKADLSPIYGLTRLARDAPLVSSIPHQIPLAADIATTMLSPSISGYYEAKNRRNDSIKALKTSYYGGTPAERADIIKKFPQAKGWPVSKGQLLWRR